MFHLWGKGDSCTTLANKSKEKFLLLVFEYLLGRRWLLMKKEIMNLKQIKEECIGGL